MLCSLYLLLLSDATATLTRFCTSYTTQSFTKQHTHLGSFQSSSIVLRAPSYPTDLLLTHSIPTGETRPITHHITCNSKNLIHMVHCKRCYQQYIGATKKRLKDRFNEHRRSVDNPTNVSKPTTVSE